MIMQTLNNLFILLYLILKIFLVSISRYFYVDHKVRAHLQSEKCMGYFIRKSLLPYVIKIQCSFEINVK